MSFHSNNTKDVFTTGWDSAELSFDEIPNWVRQDKLMGYCSNLLIDGSRESNKDRSAETGIERYAGKESILIIDIDNKLGKRTITIPQAIDTFGEFKYIIVTTKSHSENFHNFRLFIELDNMIDDYHDRKKIMDYVYSTYPFIDQACKNCNRLFYTSPIDALVYKNEKGKVFNTSKILKNSNKYHSITKMDDKQQNDTLPIPMPNQEFKTVKWMGRTIKILKENKHEEEYNGEITEDGKLKGVQTLLDNEYVQGSKGNTLFKASAMLKKDGFDDDFIFDYLMAEWTNRGSSTDKFRDFKQNVLGGLKCG